MDLDDFLPHAGDWDRYQYLLLGLVCLPLCVPCSFHTFLQVIISMKPDHWCRVPSLIDDNVTLDERKNISLPRTDSTYSQCSFYDINYTVWNSSQDHHSSLSPCKYGWEYSHEEIQSSVVVDFDLVCSRSILPAVALSIYNVGGLFGSFLFGYLSDKAGRKISYFVCLTILIIGGTGTALATEFVSWTVMRFIVGLTIPSVLYIPSVICLEVVSPNKRTLASFLTNSAYATGLLLFSLVSYGIREWRTLCYAATLPFILFYLYILVLPESLRWLLARGRVEEAEKVLRRVAQVNQKEPSNEVWEQFKETAVVCYEKTLEQRQGVQVGLSDLFKTPNMRLKTIIVSFSWVVNETVYIGLGYYGPSMGSNMYLSFFLSSLVEIPGYIACLVLMDRWGRRILLCVCMVISGLAAIGTALVPQEATTAALVLFLIAKMTIAAGTMIIFQYAGELYPTEVRGLGIGLSNYVGGLGLVVIPFINYLGTQWLALPLAIMGVLCLIGGVVTLRLPETLNQKLPQTLEEGESFGKDFQWLPSLIETLRFSACKGSTASRANTEAKNGGIDAPSQLFQTD